MRILIGSLMVLIYLTAGLFSPALALDSAAAGPKYTGGPNADPWGPYIYVKSKEEIALDLFMNALNNPNIGELKLLKDYDAYLEAYKKALRAVENPSPAAK